jgi:hypothetical protein
MDNQYKVLKIDCCVKPCYKCGLEFTGRAKQEICQKCERLELIERIQEIVIKSIKNINKQRILQALYDLEDIPGMLNKLK